ncbi:MAG: VTT domain-containing protein [Myxococcota bacterium]
MVARVVGIAAAAAIAVALAFGWSCFPSVDTLAAGVEWIRNAGPLGYLAFIAAYGVHTVLMLPASWSHGTAGFLYGPILGPILASACATGFSAVNFYLGRTLLRGWVERRIAKSRRLSALDSVIGSGGAWLVLMLRLPPLSPFNPMSAILGATRVRFRDFLLGTWLGGLLPVVFFGWLGASATDIAAVLSGEGAPTSLWMQLLPLAITLVITVYITRYAKRAIDDALGPEQELEPAS